jgi:hypothetical protein
LSELQNASVILKELFATEESFSIENIQIPRQSKKSFSVGMTIRLCHSEGAFCDWRIFPFSKTLKFLAERKRFLVKAKTAFLSEWQYVFVFLKELFATEESFLFRKH